MPYPEAIQAAMEEAAIPRYPCPKCGTTERVQVMFRVLAGFTMGNLEGQLAKLKTEELPDLEATCMVWDEWRDPPHEVVCSPCGTPITDARTRHLALQVYRADFMQIPWEVGV